ncbi:MAG: hypothetical protein IJF45_00740 [Clostridia bacterium]|nr:hypothetical protein [Clostridia bacterium]
MFGYVKIEKAELRVREYEYYRAAYCGLCRSMGKCTGQCSRLTLSYDIAFLTQVRMALVGTEPQFKKRRCIAHPFRARMMMEPNAELAYAADASALLAYEKCRDDVADKRGFGKLAAMAKKLLLQSAYRRARKRHPALAATLREKLTALAALEGELRATVDEPAAIFGEILAALLGDGLPQEAARIAEAIGTKIGRFIYIVDAIDDIEHDERSGNFNPLLLLFGTKPTTEQRQMLEDALLSLLDDTAAALDLVGDGTRYPYRAILENILYLGMPSVAKRVIWGDVACRKEEVSE